MNDRHRGSWSADGAPPVACNLFEYVYTLKQDAREVRRAKWPIRRAGAADAIWRNARLATLAADRQASASSSAARSPCRARIVFAGRGIRPASDWRDGADVIDCEGRWITPGLIDCHTHLVYGGDRAREFEMRLAGASYEEIARAGGGIVSTRRRDARGERRRTCCAAPCRGSTR